MAHKYRVVQAKQNGSPMNLAIFNSREFQGRGPLSVARFILPPGILNVRLISAREVFQGEPTYIQLCDEFDKVFNVAYDMPT